jgi:epoxyqueuosine reductase
MNTKDLSDFILNKARLLGFDECGIAPARFLEKHAQQMEKWLEAGYQAEMSYLERNKDKRYNPALLVENTRSVVSVLFNYYPAKQLNETGNFKIAKYAYGKDYHQVIRQRLMLLLKAIEEQTGQLEARVFTDSAPVLDRAWAEECGLGFIGKNTCLIHPRKGSFFFIGHLFLPLDLEKRAQTITDYCGTCTRCIDACPTGAINAPHTLDANRCISYLTIEHRGNLPEQLKEKFSNYIFGCDICQDVCPWNRFARPHSEPLFEPSERLMQMEKRDWQNLTKDDYKTLFRDSAVERTRYEGLMRNILFLSENDRSSDV